MKYNSELFELSEKLPKSITNINIDKELEIELLEVLLKKCREAIPENDKIKITFNYPMFGLPESGYNLIYSLVKKNKFDSVANEYGFYIKSINMYHNDYSDDNIEIIWDYKVYNDSIKTLKLTNR